MMTRLGRSSLTLFAAFGLLVAFSPGRAAVTLPKPINTVQPVPPPELMEKGIDGRAVVVMHIDAKGVVTDATVDSATEPAFGEAAVAAAKQWTFEPATRDGQPIAIKVKQPFNFPAPADRKLSALAGHEVFPKIADPVVEVSALANAPIMLNFPAPTYPPALAGSGRAPTLKITFVLNPEGEPLNPEVQGDTDREFFYPVLQSLVMARWEPPRQDNKPVYAKMTIAVTIAEDKPPVVQTVP